MFGRSFGSSRHPVFVYQPFLYSCRRLRDLKLLPAGPVSSAPSLQKRQRAGAVHLAFHTEFPCRVVRGRRRWSWGQSPMTPFSIFPLASPFPPSSLCSPLLGGRRAAPFRRWAWRRPRVRHSRLQQAQPNGSAPADNSPGGHLRCHGLGELKDVG